MPIIRIRSNCRPVCSSPSRRRRLFSGFRKAVDLVGRRLAEPVGRPPFGSALTPAAVFALCLVTGWAGSEPTLGQQPSSGRPYSGLDASAEAHARQDARRRWEIGRQRLTIGALRWFPGAAFAEAMPPVGHGWHAAAGPYAAHPWTWVAAPDWTSPLWSGAGQPIDQVQIRTGPNRWEPHPVFAESQQPAAAAPRARPRRLTGPREF